MLKKLFDDLHMDPRQRDGMEKYIADMDDQDRGFREQEQVSIQYEEQLAHIADTNEWKTNL